MSNEMNDSDVDTALYLLTMSKHRYDTDEELHDAVIEYIRKVYATQGVGCRLVSLNRRFGTQCVSFGRPLKGRLEDYVRARQLSVERIKGSIIVVPQPQHNENMELYSENLEARQIAVAAVFANAE